MLVTSGLAGHSATALTDAIADVGWSPGPAAGADGRPGLAP